MLVVAKHALEYYVLAEPTSVCRCPDTLPGLMIGSMRPSRILPQLIRKKALASLTKAATATKTVTKPYERIMMDAREGRKRLKVLKRVGMERVALYVSSTLRS